MKERKKERKRSRGGNKWKKEKKLQERGVINKEREKERENWKRERKRRGEEEVRKRERTERKKEGGEEEVINEKGRKKEKEIQILLPFLHIVKGWDHTISMFDISNVKQINKPVRSILKESTGGKHTSGHTNNISR
jgi:hypothetical protein